MKTGYVYYLKDYTAPKVFNGLYFECLLTDQKIPANAEIKEDTETALKDWKHEIYRPERFTKSTEGTKLYSEEQMNEHGAECYHVGADLDASFEQIPALPPPFLIHKDKEEALSDHEIEQLAAKEYFMDGNKRAFAHGAKTYRDFMTKQNR